MVVAGYDGSSRLSTTEILLSGSTSWVTISSLPISVSGLRTVNYKNTILTFSKIVIDIYQDYYQVLIIVCIFRRMG